MNQKRLKERLEDVRDKIKKAEAVLDKTSSKDFSHQYTKYELERIEPLEYALRKSVEKPARMEGERAHCPDCGTNVRFSDNFCRKCGQRLSIKKGDKRWRQRK